MQGELNQTKSALLLNWFKKNIAHEAPIIGHTLSERTWSAFQHDMKHFFSMLVGMVAMMAIPMPMEMSKKTPSMSPMTNSTQMPMSEHQENIAELALKFFFMTLYMYVGMFVGGVVFNLGKTALSACKATPSSEPEESDINDPHRGLLNYSVGFVA